MAHSLKDGAELEPQILPKWTLGSIPQGPTAFVVKNTFVDDEKDLASLRGGCRRAKSVPPPRSQSREDLLEAVKACSESTGCSDDGASLEDCEDPVLDALPTDVRTDVVQAIEAVFRQRCISVEGCELEMDDEEDEDCTVRATFSVLSESDGLSPVSQMPSLLSILREALVAELGPRKLDEHNEALRLVLGGPFRRTEVSLLFVAA